MYTTETLKERIRQVHGSTYDLTKTVYNGYQNKVTLTCPQHGDFQIRISHLVGGQGCPKCRYIKSANKKRTKLEDVIKKCVAVHGDTYDYSSVTEYKDYKTPISITCRKHGVFKQSLLNHIHGEGCPICGREKSDAKRRIGHEAFLKKAREVHGYKYEYPEEITLTSDKITITCPIHGDFKMAACNHLMGQGCRKCSRLRISEQQKLSLSDYITRATEVHNGKYTYDHAEYDGIDKKITITCPIHGDFEQRAANHLYLANGCQKCAESISYKEEEVTEYVKSIMKGSLVITRNRSILSGRRELDIYIPSKNIAIEFDGVVWHSEMNGKDKMYHLNKTTECADKGIQLIHIFEDEWDDKKDIVKSRLRTLLGAGSDRKIFARNCTIREVDGTTAKDFLNKNHIQGYCQSTTRLGLYTKEGELVSLMTFGTSRHFIGNGSKTCELLRFCNTINTSVVGGASKLLKHYIKEYNPTEIISYADRRWSTGHLYNTLGFKLYNTSAPSYSYVVNNKRVFRFNLRKSVLVSKYGCDPSMSEHEFCLSKHWYRIYDCGCLCYRLTCHE